MSHLYVALLSRHSRSSRGLGSEGPRRAYRISSRETDVQTLRPAQDQRVLQKSTAENKVFIGADPRDGDTELHDLHPKIIPANGVFVEQSIDLRYSPGFTERESS